MHNAHAPIIVTRLFSTAFCHRGARLIKVNCRRLAYLSACGKYLQLFKVNCRRLAYLKPRLHGGSNPDSTRIRFACERYQPGFQSG